LGVTIFPYDLGNLGVVVRCRSAFKSTKKSPADPLG